MHTQTREQGGEDGVTFRMRRAGLRAFRVASGKELITSAHADGNPRRYIISDTHFGHGNIIQYCNRPFLLGDFREMDEALIRNWNHVVRPEDTVYVVGDFVFGKKAKQWWQYAEKLNGNKIYFQGNHDRFDGMRVKEQMEMEIEGIRFLILHNPAHAPDNYDGWVIHGHVHNNNPFISFGKKRVNVSCDVTEYRPVDLDRLAEAIRRESEAIRNGKGDKVAVATG